MARATVSRRSFLKGAGAGIAASAALGCQTTSPAPTAAKRPPNILFIISDEHHAGVMGCAGNDIVHTPNLDGLAADGLVFENCYCNSPLCVPSRLSITSGKYVSRVGAWSNNCWLPSDDYPSLPRLLNASGYESFLCGKMHYDNTRRYGFTEIGGNMNRGKKSGTGNRRAADDLEPTPGISGRFDEFHTGDTSPVLEHDRAVTAGSIEFLKNRKASDRPFFLLSGYLAPHFPLIIPESYYEPYKGRVPMPEIPEGFFDTMPLNYKHLRIGFNVEDVPDDIVLKGRELYYGFVQWVDAEIGKLLSALGESEVADNTVVIYTSDHGENMGEHGMWWKNCVYESAAHIPLIVSYPPMWKGGQRRTQVCSLVDVVQTIAELAEAGAPGDWNGDSLCPVLKSNRAEWKDTAISEYYGHNVASGFVMLREGKFKYVYHTRPDDQHDAFRELYDLEADPGEFNNLAADAKFQTRVESMHATLLRELPEDPEITETRCRADYAKGYGRTDVGDRGGGEG